ncbi:MAG: rhodanese-like domain-containing protein [Lewinella sp.]|nr:rhodanese-like domain-containing protein [Lewinella sp.]
MIPIVLLLPVLLLAPIVAALAQRPVESGAYQLMLKTLLAHSVPEASVAEITEEQGEVTYLDARERREYEVSHIPGAIWVGYDDFDLSRVRDVAKDARLVVYCSVGYRSEKVTEQLLANGWRNVRNLYGGIFEWKNQGHAVVTPAGEETERVHAYNRTWGIWLRSGEKVYGEP